jgi:hypothetical protein
VLLAQRVPQAQLAQLDLQLLVELLMPQLRHLQLMKLPTLLLRD